MLSLIQQLTSFLRLRTAVFEVNYELVFKHKFRGFFNEEFILGVARDAFIKQNPRVRFQHIRFRRIEG